MADKCVAKIYETTDYNRFRYIEGNRKVNHAKKIVQSIQAIGRLMKPVLINEKWEIIDGQGTVAACKFLNIPVYYVVQVGIGKKEVSYLNKNMTKWSVNDFVNYYGKGDDAIPAYQRLNTIVEQFPEFDKYIVIKAASEDGIGNASSKLISAGEYDGMDLEGMTRAINRLGELKRFLPIVKKKPYAKQALMAILFVIAIREKDPNVNLDQLYEGMEGYYTTCEKGTTMEYALRNVEYCYNYKRRTDNKYFFMRAYEDIVREKAMKNLKAHPENLKQNQKRKVKK